VIDEPFYAVYLDRTGADHPMREDTLASQSTNWRAVVNELLSPLPEEYAVFYQKHMTHHMVEEIGLDWMAHCRNAFLIRSPERVLASYAAKRPDVTLDDIGFARQAELFEIEAERLGTAPPVIDADDVLADPRRVLTELCGALGIPFKTSMLRWPAGPRSTDGLWAPVWYGAVEASTGFATPATSEPVLDERLAAIAESARPYYHRLAQYRLAPARTPVEGPPKSS
jgi:hypothetical protein